MTSSSGEAAGARETGPLLLSVSGMGRFAVLQDPQGAYFAVVKFTS